MTKENDSEKKMLVTYANLMEEIKRRVEVVFFAATSASPIPLMASFELCYIQLRKIVEVLALACLTAHGDIPAVRGKLLQKSYNADQIIKQLDQLHSEFFPVAGRQILDQRTLRPIEVVPIEGVITKHQLLELYGECGNYLHRGSIRQLLTRWEPKMDFKRIIEWIEKIMVLLNHHQIQTFDLNKQIWVLMKDKDDGLVKCSIMQRKHLV